MESLIGIEPKKLKELIERLQFLEESKSRLEVRLSLYEPVSDVIEYPQIKYEEFLNLTTSEGQTFQKLLISNENSSLLNEVKRLNTLIKDLEVDKELKERKLEEKNNLLKSYNSQYNRDKEAIKSLEENHKQDLESLQTDHTKELENLKSKVLNIIEVSENLPIDIFEDMELFLKSGFFSRFLFWRDMVSKIRDLYKVLYDSFSQINHYEFVKEVKENQKKNWINNKLIGK